MDKLMQNLIQAKKVMNKVESGDYSKGNINRDIIKEAPEDVMANMMPVPQEPQLPPQLSQGEYKNRVSESKLPDAIKMAMIEKPIPQAEINFGNSLSLEFTDKVAKQMERLNLKQSPKKQPAPQPQRRAVNEDYETGNVGRSSNGSFNELLINEMKPLIKEIIQSTLEATIEKVLNEKLNKIEKTTKINESLQIKVGNSIFVGKLVEVKEAKK
jgi:hypothetical protein